MKIKYAWALALSLCLFAGNAFKAQAAGDGQFSKLSPYTRLMLLERQQNPGDYPRMLSAFVGVKDTSAFGALTDLGCRIQTRADKFATLLIPMAMVENISSRSDVVYVEAAQKLNVMMDSTRSAVHAQTAFDATRMAQPYTGRGVLVGIIDTGFDYTHPTLYDPTGSHYRVVRAVDWTSDSTQVVYADSAAILAAQHSDNALQQYHGTHVAGIAAGGGYGSPYRGIACESNIMLYSGSDESVDYLNGTKAIFDYAESLGMPAVVNLSSGSGMHPHDNTSLFSQMINRIVGPGKIFVESAGNYGGHSQHIALRTPGDTLHTVLTPEGNTICVADVWSGKAGGTFAVSLNLYNNETQELLGTTGFFSATSDNVLQKEIKVGKDIFRVRMASQLYPYNGKRNVMIACDNPRDRGYSFRLFVTSPDSLTHAWALFSQFTTQDVGYPYLKGDDEQNLCDEACAEGVIAVGAINARPSLTDMEGRDVRMQAGRYGEIPTYSCFGPTADGRVKPDVVAPGSYIVSAWNHFCTEPRVLKRFRFIRETTFRGRAYQWIANSGTSMASPVVAGVVALWLQANPMLTPQDVRAIIARTSTQTKGITYPNSQWGYGVINAYKGLLSIAGAEAAGVTSFSAPQEGVSVYAGKASGECHVRWVEKPRRYAVEVLDAAGRRVAKFRSDKLASADCILQLPSLPAATYTFIIKTEKGSAKRQFQL